MRPKRLVILSEGHGDVLASHVIVDRLLRERQPWDSLFLDPDVIRVGGIERFTGKLEHKKNWLNRLGIAQKRGNLGGVLLLLDGDCERVEGKRFCPKEVAVTLAERARVAGAGQVFSLVCVFASFEFESWLIAGIESLAGRLLPGDRPGVRVGTTAPSGDLEHSHRGAKEWLSGVMESQYKATTDQAALTKMVDLQLIRNRNLRSFRRLEHAIDELIEAIRTERHVATPSARRVNEGQQGVKPGQ